MYAYILHMYAYVLILTLRNMLCRAKYMHTSYVYANLKYTYLFGLTLLVSTVYWNSPPPRWPLVRIPSLAIQINMWTMAMYFVITATSCMCTLERKPVPIWPTLYGLVTYIINAEFTLIFIFILFFIMCCDLTWASKHGHSFHHALYVHVPMYISAADCLMNCVRAPIYC